jgi:hypothetical protein
MNYSALKKIILLLAAALFLFSFDACSTARGPVGFEREQGVRNGYRDEVKKTKNKKVLPNTPSHGYLATYQYRYYPNCRVYYDDHRKLYFYLESLNWQISASLPNDIQERLDDYVSIETDTDNPYIYYKEHQRKYSPAQAVWGETSKTTPWQHIESRYAVIKYKTLEDLERFNDSIDYLPSKQWLKKLFSFFEQKDPIVSVKQKVDALFERVQQILDTGICKDKVNINIYPNKKSFYEVRKKMIGEDSHFRAWYIFEENTIYINADDVHDGILAHEIAYVIIDHYLNIRPSKAIFEILAIYADENLYY